MVKLVTQWWSCLLKYLVNPSLFRLKRRLGVNIVLYLMVAINPIVVKAQLDPQGNIFSLSGSAAALSTSSFGASGNPSGISLAHHFINKIDGFDESLPNYRGSLSWYVTRYFGIRELQSTGVSLHHGLNFWNNSTLGIEAHHFGFDLFRETTVLTGFSSMILESSARVGLCLGWHQTLIKNYGSTNTYTISAGFIYSPREDFRFGAMVRDFVVGSAGDFLHGIYSTNAIGMTYQPLDDLIIAGTFYKSGIYPAQINVGLTYNILGFAQIGGGYTTISEEWHGSIGIKWRKLRFGYLMRNHISLGWTHGTGISQSW